ncbi:MAG: heavy metal-binding domain-containing protein [Pseudomonadota bacterium]
MTLPTGDLLIQTNETLFDRDVLHAIGTARGSTVLAGRTGLDITAALRNLVHGATKRHVAFLTGPSEQPLHHTISEALKKDDSAVVTTRIAPSSVKNAGFEPEFYGTQARLR